MVDILGFVFNVLASFVSSGIWTQFLILLLAFSVILCLIKVVWVFVQSR